MNKANKSDPSSLIFEMKSGPVCQGVDLHLAMEQVGGQLSDMPYVIRVFMENLLRSHLQGKPVSAQEIDSMLHWSEHISGKITRVTKSGTS